jgi:hypothetical protein
MGGLGGGVCATRSIVAGMEQRGRMRWLADLDHRVAAESKSSKSRKSIVSDYRPTDAGRSGAESSRRGRTP